MPSKRTFDSTILVKSKPRHTTRAQARTNNAKKHDGILWFGLSFRKVIYIKSPTIFIQGPAKVDFPSSLNGIYGNL